MKVIPKFEFDTMVKTQGLETITKKEWTEKVNSCYGEIEKSMKEEISDEKKEEIEIMKSEINSFEPYDVICQGEDRLIKHETIFVKENK